MDVYRAAEHDVKGVRKFPWSEALYDPSCKYYDFKVQPGLIYTHLEDFSPWSHQPAIQVFYKYLEWLNSINSALESDDSAFGGLTKNGSADARKALQLDGRIMLFYRELRYNCLTDKADSLLECFNFHFQRVSTDLTSATVGLARAHTLFKKIRLEGRSLVLYFWAFGETEEEVWATLQKVFVAIWEASKNVSRQIGEATLPSE